MVISSSFDELQRVANTESRCKVNYEVHIGKIIGPAVSRSAGPVHMPPQLQV